MQPSRESNYRVPVEAMTGVYRIEDLTIRSGRTPFYLYTLLEMGVKSRKEGRNDGTAGCAAPFWSDLAHLELTSPSQSA